MKSPAFNGQRDEGGKAKLMMCSRVVLGIHVNYRFKGRGDLEHNTGRFTFDTG